MLNSGDQTISQYAIKPDGSLSQIATPIAAGAAPFSIVIDPAGRFIYTTNFASGSVSQFIIHRDGSLSQIADPIATGEFPYSIAVNPSGRFVYVANYKSGTLSQYNITPDGNLSPMTIAPLATGRGPSGIATVKQEAVPIPPASGAGDSLPPPSQRANLTHQITPALRK